MLFNSLTFVVFFAVVLALHMRPGASWRAKRIQLLVASYVFYAAWSPPFVLLLLLSTVVDWKVAHAIERSENKGRRKALLLISLAVNLGVLGYFKYGAFLLESFVGVMASLGVAWEPAAPSIVLPMGISFYTFQTMAYSLDVYLERAKPGDSFLNFALFVTFFPQLVAGPIVRPTELIPQFEQEPTRRSGQFAWGLALMTLGLFQKVVLADGALAPHAEAIFDGGMGPPKLAGALDAWVGTLAFAGQIFFDFAGYSTTAIGAALVLGFSLPDNFRSPYAAVGFSDFWRRWHITLSTWLRDYLYIPLGGNRRGRARTQINLMITMLLGGLWHGASWTFVIWGALHGGYLAAERLAQRLFAGAAWTQHALVRVFMGVLTFVLVNLAWVFFRAKDFASAGKLLSTMTGWAALTGGERGEAVLQTHALVEVCVVVGGLVLTHAYMRERRLEDLVARAPAWLVGVVWGAMAWAIIATQGSGDAFIYFQF
jgi:alginate O-acetyltransferase complex protein AlgI